jgi:hypothetical protein
MAITIDSTTDSAEAVLAATGGVAKAKETEEKKSATVETTDEKKEASDASESAAENDADDESAEDSEEDSKDEGDSKEPDAKPKKKKGFKKRIDKLNLRVSEKEQEVEYWKAQALKQQQPKTESALAQEKAPTEIEGKPRADKFETHEEYVEALTDWKLEHRERERETKSREAQVKLEYEKTAQSFQAKIAEFKESNDDFDDVVSDVDDIPLPMTVQDAIRTSDVGPALMYELAKNRDDLERIVRLSPIAAAREIGKIEARISKEPETRSEKKSTKAPPPISPVGSKGTAKVMKSPEDMSIEEYKQWRNNQK